MCRDALVLLQCHIRVWKIRGARRILLSVLQQILAANTNTTLHSSPMRQPAFEILAARDVILARSLILVTSAAYVINDFVKGDVTPIYCPITIHTVRFLIVQRTSLAMALI